MYPRPDKPSLHQHESAIVLDPTRRKSTFEANVCGSLFFGTRIDDDHNGTLGIHIYELVSSVLLFLEHTGKMLRAFGYSGPILIEQ
jgi:hypothetical protein